MKKNQLYIVLMRLPILFLALICINQGAFAQTWNLAGNAAIPVGSYLGTSDANDIVFKTTGVTRATFKASGGLNMGTDLKFTSASNGITFAATTGARTIRPMMYMFASGTANTDRMVIAHSSAFQTYGLQYQDASDKFNFLGNGTNVMTIDLSSKHVGITTNSPAYPLHVTGSHITEYVTSDYLNPGEPAMKCVIDIPFNYGATALYCKGNTANGTATAGYFESDFIAVDGHAASGASGTAYGTSGTATNGTAAYGAWGSASGATFSYAVYASGTLAYTGSLVHVSDQKLKKNIQVLPKALDKIMQLKPSVYEYKTDEFARMNLAGGKHFGFIAQDLQKVLPEVVSNNLFPAQYDEKHNKIADEVKYLGVSYEEIIPVMVAAIQEQQKIIDEKTQQVDAILQQLEDMKKDIAAVKENTANNVVANATISSNMGTAYLLQNIPNPTNGNTTIKYYIPSKISNASLAVYNMQGQQLKFITLTVTGNASTVINTKELAPGMYVYRLTVNGQIADSKTMEIIK